MDEAVATLYIEFGRVLYRFKIFRESIGIERQTPRSELGNQSFSKSDNPNADLLYNPDTEAWNIDAMLRLIDEYENAISHK